MYLCILQYFLQMTEIVLIILAYLIGSIPSAVWVSKTIFGIDSHENKINIEK